MSGLSELCVDRPAAPAPADSVRDSMCRLPKAFALPLTMLTGTPHTGQRPFRFTPTTHLVNAVASTLAGLLANVVALGRGGWFLTLVPVGWAMTLHGTRNLRMMIYHQCAHRNMWRHKRLDRAVGRVLAAVLMVQGFDRYSTEHVRDHHAARHMTLLDPTVQAILVGLGLGPRMTRRQMWRRVLAKLVSPRFHVRFLVARSRSYFHFASVTERLCTVVAAAAVAGTATVMHGWVFVVVAWVVPQTVLYQVSNTLRLCVKHTFPSPDQTNRRGRAYFASLTNAIFLGEPAPSPTLPSGLRRRAWCRWWLRMLFVHLPARYLVLTGDTVCHDFHHRHPMDRNWANYIFARADDTASLQPGSPPYRQVWGMVPAIDRVFASLAEADPAEYDAEQLARVSDRELFSAFDD